MCDPHMAHLNVFIKRLPVDLLEETETDALGRNTHAQTLSASQLFLPDRMPPADSSSFISGTHLDANGLYPCQVPRRLVEPFPPPNPARPTGRVLVRSGGKWLSNHHIAIPDSHAELKHAQELQARAFAGIQSIVARVSPLSTTFAQLIY